MKKKFCITSAHVLVQRHYVDAKEKTTKERKTCDGERK